MEKKAETPKTMKFKISELKPGMIIGKTIINDNDGTVILKKGKTLKDEDISFVKKYFKENKGKIKLGLVNRQDTIFKIGEEEIFLAPKTSNLVASAISQKHQQEALSVVDSVMKDVRMGNNVNCKKAEKAVESVLDDIIGNADASLNLLNIKNFDDYTYTHCVNVSTISLLIGARLKLKRNDSLQLGVGALLHDLGKTKIPLEILNKVGKLTDDEFNIMKQHPTYTYEILKDEKGVSNIAIHIASQHHEKYDGNGYPNRLRGDDINYYARIVAIADVYDALTTDRVYRKAMLPYEAMKIIISGSGTHFDADIVQVFLKSLSIYPVGSNVKLNTGEVAVVKKVDPSRMIRPEILIIKDKFGKRIKSPEYIDLLKDKKRFLTGAVQIDE